MTAKKSTKKVKKAVSKKTSKKSTKKTSIKKVSAKKTSSKKTSKKLAKKASKKTAKKTSKKSVTTAKDIVSSEETDLESVSVIDNATKKLSKQVIKAIFAQTRVITESTDIARELNNSRAFGTIIDGAKVQLSLTEALYLLEKKRISIVDEKDKPIDFQNFITKANEVEPNFWIRYAVYKDMRNRGYVVKTALKFGADFRVYDRGIKPGEDHARWIVYPVYEGERYTWFDFAAKNRVAHSTKKRLLMGVVDDENDVTYWEIKWVRP
ncbi:MAG: tRNA-intron lyase [Patescibacteria group bacterium]|nr:tRNA-intron lyase [Patescibacteria group bacterium]